MMCYDMENALKVLIQAIGEEGAGFFWWSGHFVTCYLYNSSAASWVHLLLPPVNGPSCHGECYTENTILNL